MLKQVSILVFSVFQFVLLFIFVFIFIINVNNIPKVYKNNTPLIFPDMLKPKNIDFVYSYEFKQPTYANDVINTSNFNYDGKCREIFKYPANNKRDLFITSVGFSGLIKNYWEDNKKEITTIMALANNTFPNAKKLVLLLPGEENKDFEETTKYY
ncbi:hypothetical protein EIN_337500, partial [Entamoeba invadens IP1]